MAGLKDPFDTETRRKLLESASGGFNVTPPAMPAYTPPQPGGLSVEPSGDDFYNQIRSIPMSQPQAPQAPAEPQGSSFLRNYVADPLVALGGGAASLVTDVGGLALTEPASWLGAGINKLTGWDTMERGAAQMKDYVAQASQGTRDVAHGLLSPEAKKLMESQFVREARQGEGGDFSFLGTDYRFNPNDMGFAQSLGKMGLHFLESAPASLGGMAIGAKAAQMASRAIPAVSKLSPAWGAALPTGIQAGAFGLSEGIMAGEQNANQMRAQILNMSEGEKQQNANYSLWVDKLRGQGMGLEQAREEATRRVADETYNAIRQMTVPTTALLSAPTGALTGNVASRLFGMGTAQQAEQAAAQGLGRSALQYLKFGGAEAAQETPQSAAETYAQNLATAGFYPERDFGEGVLDAAITGGLVGGLSGAAFHGAGNLANRMRGQQPPEQATPPDSPAAGNYPRVDALGQFDTETEGPLPGVPGLRGFPQYGGGLDQAQPQAAPMPQDLIRADQLQSGQEVDLLGNPGGPLAPRGAGGLAGQSGGAVTESRGGNRNSEIISRNSEINARGGLTIPGVSDPNIIDAEFTDAGLPAPEQRRGLPSPVFEGEIYTPPAPGQLQGPQGRKALPPPEARQEAAEAIKAIPAALFHAAAQRIAPDTTPQKAAQLQRMLTREFKAGNENAAQVAQQIIGQADMPEFQRVAEAMRQYAGQPQAQPAQLPAPAKAAQETAAPQPTPQTQAAAQSVAALPPELFHRIMQQKQQDIEPARSAQMQQALAQQIATGDTQAAQAAAQVLRPLANLPDYRETMSRIQQAAVPAKARQGGASSSRGRENDGLLQAVRNKAGMDTILREYGEPAIQQAIQDGLIEPGKKSLRLTQAGKRAALQAAPQPRPVETVAPESMPRPARVTKGWYDGIRSTIVNDVFKDHISQSIQKDGQRVLTAIQKGDVATLDAIRKKYQKEAGKTFGGGGSGPGKVDWGRLGAHDVFASAERAFDKLSAGESYLEERKQDKPTPEEMDAIRKRSEAVGAAWKPPEKNYRRVNGRLVQAPDAGIVTIKEAGGEKLTVQKLTDEERQAFAREGEKGNYAVVHANSGEIVGIGLGKGGAAKAAAKNIRDMVAAQGWTFPEIAKGFTPITQPETGNAAQPVEAEAKPRAKIEGAAKTAEEMAAQLAERKKAKTAPKPEPQPEAKAETVAQPVGNADTMPAQVKWADVNGRNISNQERIARYDNYTAMRDRFIENARKKGESKHEINKFIKDVERKFGSNGGAFPVLNVVDIPKMGAVDVVGNDDVVTRYVHSGSTGDFYPVATLTPQSDSPRFSKAAPEEKPASRYEQKKAERLAKETANKKASAERMKALAKKNRQINPVKDDLLAAIAKAGGLQVDDALAEFGWTDKDKRGRKTGKRPEEIKGLRGAGTAFYVFTKKGMSFDAMAEKLSQYGYPVFTDDNKGSDHYAHHGDHYSANALLNAVQAALSGKKVYAPEGIDARTEEQIAEEEAQQAELEAQAQYEPLIPDGVIARQNDSWLDTDEIPPQVIEEFEGYENQNSQKVSELSAILENEGGNAEYLIELAIQNDYSDEMLIQMLEESINDIRSERSAGVNPANEESGSMAAADPAGRDGLPEKQSAGTQGQTVGKDGQVDAFGGKTDTQQQLADRNAAIDRKLGKGLAQPSLQAGSGAALFGGNRQADIEDMAGVKQQDAFGKPVKPRFSRPASSPQLSDTDKQSLIAKVKAFALQKMPGDAVVFSLPDGQSFKVINTPEALRQFREWVEADSAGKARMSVQASLFEATQASLFQQRKAEAKRKGITAWHGTPHEVDKFSTEKIGTGEGAQVYGWGLYFSENRKDVAEGYRNDLTKRENYTKENPAWDRFIKNYFHTFIYGRGDFASAKESAIETLKRNYEFHRRINDQKSAEEDIKSLSAMNALTEDEYYKYRVRGRLYQVNINAAEDELLDWDKPVWEQSEKVKAALKSLGVDMEPAVFDIEKTESGKSYRVYRGNSVYGTYRTLKGAKDRADELSKAYAKNGKSAYLELSAGNLIDYKTNKIVHTGKGDDEASKELRDLGIKGIKYIGEFKRTGGKGAINYVIFQDSDIEILQRLSKQRRGAGGLSKAQAEKLIRPVTSQWGDAGTRVRVVQTQEELAAALPHVTGLQSANGAVEGLYDPKSRAIYLVADNLNEARILPVLAHEAVGHYAAENFIHAPEYRKALDTVARLEAAGDKRVMRWLERVDATQPGLPADVRAMEALAQAVESGEYKSQPAIVKAINAIVNLVKKALAAIGFNNAWINTQSRADLLNMLRTAEARMRQSRGQVVPDANYINSQAPEAARVLAEDMPSRDALETAYLNNPLNTKIAGLNAYHELLERYHRGEKGVFQRAQVSIDVDDLGGMNSVGMKFADELLIQFGDVLKRIAERESGGKVQVIHLHGDEFYVQGPDTATVNAAMNAARAEMSRMKFETVAEYKDGKDTVRIPWIAHGLNFGWGVQEIGKGVSPAQALRMADNKLNMDKANRRAKEYKKPKGLKTDFINPAELRAVPFLDGNAIIRGNASSIEAALKSGLLPWAVNPFNPKNYRAPDKGKAPALWQSNDKMGVVIPAEHIAAVNQALQRAAARFPGQFKYDVDPGNARLNELADTLAKLGKAAEAKRLRAQFGKLTPQQGPAKVAAMVELQQAIIAAYEAGAKEPEVGVPHEAPHEAMPLSGEMSEAELQRAYLNSPTERETLGKNYFLDENEKGRKGKANKLQKNFAALGVRDMAYANDNTSHATGDAMIQAFARRFREVGKAHGIELIHIGGGDFYAQHQDGDKAALEKFLRDTLPPAMATVEIEDFDEQGTPWKVQGIQFDYQAGSAKPGETQAAALKRANDELSARKKAEEADKTRIAKGQKPDYINPQKLTVPNLPDAKGNYVIKGNPEAIRATLGSLLEGYPAEVAANKGGLALSISKEAAARLRDQVAQMQGTQNKFSYDIDPDGKLAENYLRKLEELGQRDLAKTLSLSYENAKDFDAKERMLGNIRETYNDIARKNAAPAGRNGRTGTPGENQDGEINPGFAAGSAAQLRAGSQGRGEEGKERMSAKKTYNESFLRSDMSGLADRAKRVAGVNDSYRLPNLSSHMNQVLLKGVKPGKTVTIYRGIPTSYKGANIRPGDWVSLDKKYAQQHGTAESGKSRVVKMVVDSMDVAWAGTDVNEFFYVPMSAKRGGSTELEMLNNLGAEFFEGKANSPDTEKFGDNQKGRFSFAGSNAETADLTELRVAVEMLEAGEDADLVRRETGWFKGADGKWRFEIDDSDAYIRPEIVDLWPTGKMAHGKMPLFRVMGHKSLYAAYPKVADIRVRYESGITQNAHYDAIKNEIVLSDRIRSDEDIKSTLLHEIQHGIQEVEGFARGGSDSAIAANPQDYISEDDRNYAKSLPAYALANDKEAFIRKFAINRLGSPYDAYRRLAGEVEARNVESRMGMSEAQRMKKAPAQTQDIPDSEVIIRWNGRDMQASMNAPENAGAAIPETIEVDGVTRPTRNSNGQPIHTTLDGIRNFWRWFGDSKVVDSQGRPLVVYHGTGADFEKNGVVEFDPLKFGSASDEGWFGKGFYFTPSASMASEYARDSSPNVMPLYLKIESPFDWRDKKGAGMRFGSNDERYATTRDIVNSGHDGVFVYDDTIGLSENESLSDEQWGLLLKHYGDRAIIIRRGNIDRALRNNRYKKSDFIERYGKSLADSMPTFRELREVVAFNANQIKSALGNTGQFSPGNNDIRFSIRDGSNEQDMEEQRGLVARVLDPARQFAGDKLADMRPWVLGSFTLRQLADMYGKLFKLADSTIKGSRKITISKGSEDKAKNYNGKGKSDVFFQTDHPVEDYDALVHRMDADAARLMQEADVIAEDWANLDPWLDRIRGNPKNRREVEDIISKADYYQVHPDNYEFQPNPNNTPEFELERQAAHGELVHRFEKLPDKAKLVYQNVRDKFKQHHAAMQDALIQRIQRSNLDGLKKKEMADEIRRQFEQASKYGPYFPFSRFGSYTVQVFHEPDARGNTFSFEKFPTRRQARQFANKEKLKGRRVVEGVDLEKQHAMQDVSSGFVTDVMNLMGDDAAAKDQLYQLYLQYMPDLSGRKHFIHRNFVQGWNPAMLRSYSSTMFHSAKQIARIRFGDLLERQLGLMESAYNNTRNGSGETDDLIAAGHVINEMRKRHELIMNPPGAWWAYMANNIGFVWHLAASPAAALVNMSQTPMVAHPVIAAAFPKVTLKGKEYDGYAGAAALFTQALWQFAKGFRAKGTPGFFSLANSEDLSQEEKAALQEAIDEGHISLTQSHDLAGRADDAGKFGTHDIMTRVSTGLGYLFHHTERANREITFIVAYRMGKAAGLQHRDALNQALNLMYAGHGDYSSNNRPRWFRSNPARVITQFKAYSQFMSYLWGRGLRQAFYGESPEVKRAARRQLLGMGLMTGGMAGVLGLPMVTTALGIMSAIAAGLSDDDEPVDLENDLRVWMANNIPESIGGKKTAEMILKGIPRGVTPADLHSRVGQQSMWFRESDKELEGHDWFSYYLEQMLGPSAGLAGRITDGLRMFASAEDGTARERAMEMMMPKFIADPLKAGRYATEGIRSMKSGDMILEPTTTEQLLKLAGFAPARYGEMIEARTVVKNAEKAIQDRRQKLVNQYWVASRFGDEVERRKVVEAIKAFNLRNKTWPITGVNLRNSARSHIRAGLRMQDGYIVNPRLKHLREKGEFLAD